MVEVVFEIELVEREGRDEGGEAGGEEGRAQEGECEVRSVGERGLVVVYRGGFGGRTDR